MSQGDMEVGATITVWMRTRVASEIEAHGCANAQNTLFARGAGPAAKAMEKVRPDGREAGLGHGRELPSRLHQ
ncbi:MAG: hypothetical protein COC20_08020 [Cellvibrionales bacterium]|nr:MAG: hypothetical protein COC20_08020 [Cellvibrionales bacterium]